MFILICMYGNAQSNQLKWDANLDKDLSHYNVYRSDAVSGPYTILNPTTKTIAVSWIVDAGDNVSTGTIKTVVYTKLNDGTLKHNSYIDTDVIVGGIYWYQITAVDTSGNESGFSNKYGVLTVDKKPPVNPTGLR